MKEKVKHLVVFSLKKNVDPLNFFKNAKQDLTQIPGVKDFEILKEFSQHIDYQYGLAMEFNSQADYEFYLTHPFHVQFVEDRWKKDVLDYLELNFKLY